MNERENILLPDGNVRPFLRALCDAPGVSGDEGGVARLIAAAVSERALHAVPAEIRKTVRSSIFKQMLLTTASDGFFERRSLQ